MSHDVASLRYYYSNKQREKNKLTILYDDFKTGEDIYLCVDETKCMANNLAFCTVVETQIPLVYDHPSI